MFEFHIEIKYVNGNGKWRRIASFENQFDRDDCIIFLAKRYSDYSFLPINDENEYV